MCIDAKRPGKANSEDVVCQPKKTIQGTDARVDRLAARIKREVDIIKMNAIMEALTNTGGSGPLGDVALLGYCTKVVSLLDIKECTLEVLDDMYSVYAYTKALQGRFPAILSHSLRVSETCVDLGKMMGLPQRDLLILNALGILHDVGKLGISDEIIFKPTSLGPKEWEEVRRHPAIGYELIQSICGISELADFVVAHHERWDGAGYPLGLRGNEIPFLSRILALADSIDAMINNRPYRKAMLPSDIVAEISRCSGRQFDPEVVEIFFDMIRARRYTVPFFSLLRGADDGGRSTICG